MASRIAFLLLFAACAIAAELAPPADFSQTPGLLKIASPCSPRKPWTIAGERGALFGRQNGEFEAWLWPVKILSHFRIRAALADYPVPIDVNALAAEVEVTPAETILTYSHAAFTIRQHMFAVRGALAAATGAAVFFEIESIRPLDLTFSFAPEMLRMWPAPNFGRPSGEWRSEGKSGFYILHTDDPKFSAIVAMPRARPGILVPYQEHPQTYPLELTLQYDPARDPGLVFPLILSMLDERNPSDTAAAINEQIPQLYRRTLDYYAHFFDKRLVVESPDTRLNEAFAWAEIAIDQAQVMHGNEIGLVAGYYESADSARPGFAWFFGRDTLWTAYAIDSYGDFALTRRALDFLIRRQRGDGKIMHEYSQAADAVDWAATPYFYASADATPLLVMAMEDYVSVSGDVDYPKSRWEAVRKAYAFTRAHESNDGIYNNSQGTGWVESWPGGMPHQEIYLAALDQQAAEAMSRLAQRMGDTQLAGAARRKANDIRAKIAAEYYDRSTDFYAFSRAEDGTVDRTATIYPSVAWWNGTFSLPRADGMLTRWASEEFSTDWGTRDISKRTAFYDPISYHQGSVWPLFTGWVALAEYRAGRSLSGYAHLMQNAGLTWTQDPGAVTELLSGRFFEPLGRSSSHQTWSSAMVILPVLRGLFGLAWDAENRTLRLAPQLPASWEHARLRNVPLGQASIDLTFERQAGSWRVGVAAKSPEVLCLVSQTAPEQPCRAALALKKEFSAPAKPVEIAIPAALPREGSDTRQLKILNETYSAHTATFTIEAWGGSRYDLPVRRNRDHLTVRGAEWVDDKLHLEFPASDRYERKSIEFDW
jgi:glycogen debranching enzyme